jgi:DNA-directed RNA polymerase subunit RPC12/RpoP
MKTNSFRCNMKLESWDELDEDDQVFCWSCGKQLFTIDEIAQRLCRTCQELKKKTGDDDVFFCWACGKKLMEMSEVAQGLCHQCKADIIRKLRTTPKKTTTP